MLARTRLPELRRDDIARALSDVHIPEIDLRESVSKLEMPKLEMPKLEMPKLEMPKIDVPKLEMPKIDVELPDVRKAMADASSALRTERPDERPRWLLVGGLVFAAVAGAVIAGVALVRDKALREPLAKAWKGFRDGVAYAIGSLGRRLRGERTDLIALDVAPETGLPAAPAAAPEPVVPAPVEEPVLVESGEPS